MNLKKGTMMAYGEAARTRRRCTATRQDGEPCRAWALWDDPRQLCVQHAGRGHRGQLDPERPWCEPVQARYAPCECAAYAWPHRPGGGLCRWPDPPLYQSPTPAGTHAWPRFTGEMQAVARILTRHYRRQGMI